MTAGITGGCGKRLSNMNSNPWRRCNPLHSPIYIILGCGPRALFLIPTLSRHLLRFVSASTVQIVLVPLRSPNPPENKIEDPGPKGQSFNEAYSSLIFFLCQFDTGNYKWEMWRSIMKGWLKSRHVFSRTGHALAY